MKKDSVPLRNQQDTIVANDSGNIISWNKGAEQMFAYPENEIVGQHLNILIPEGFKQDQKLSDMYGVKKDRGEFPIEISHTTWQANGNEYNTVIIRDITERKQAEGDWCCRFGKDPCWSRRRWQMDCARTS